jgi:hypothetical protein
MNENREKLMEIMSLILEEIRGIRRDLQEARSTAQLHTQESSINEAFNGLHNG